MLINIFLIYNYVKNMDGEKNKEYIQNPNNNLIIIYFTNIY